MAMLSQPITVYHYPLSLIAAYHRLSPTKYLLPPLFPNEPYFLLILFSPLFSTDPLLPPITAYHRLSPPAPNRKRESPGDFSPGLSRV